MNARSVLEYAKSLVQDIDAGRPLTGYGLARLITPLAVPAALTFALGLPACNEDDETPEFETSCTDSVDNDEDGLVDCNDEDCFDEMSCAVSAYGYPFEENCDDDADNDGDEAIDCDDSDCFSHEECSAMPDYGVPFED